MIKIIKKIGRIIKNYIMFPFVYSDYHKFHRSDRFSNLDLRLHFTDKTNTTTFDTHYVYHTSWAARKLKEIGPEKHVDISSSLFFVGIASAFVPIDFYDYRPANLKLSNLTCKQADLIALHFADNSIESLSCMHTIEHVGLGRYGDPIDPDGDLKAIGELIRVLKPGGSLLFVTPVGMPKVQFNAHRIYSYEQIAQYFQSLKLIEFSLINDDGIFIASCDPKEVHKQKYGCGCFLFTK